jgi:hypothetical protein
MSREMPLEQWVRQWRTAEIELQKLKMRELQPMTEEQQLDWIDAAMAVAEGMPIDSSRWNDRGLVEQQRWFIKLRHVESHL